MKANRATRAAATIAVGGSVLLFAASGSLSSALGETTHVTDGIVSPGEWPSATSTQVFFPYDASTGAGGAYLAVDQGSATGGSPGGALGTNLYLLYDYVHATSLPTPSTFFDVFFAVPPAQTDYLVRITGNTISAYEKPEGTLAPTPGGGFNPSLAPWTPLESDDLAVARFSGAIGFGTSPNSSVNHQIAEFQLSINDSTPGPGAVSNLAIVSTNGIYDATPAFWSASTPGSVPGDGPIASGIFTLNQDGTTSVKPVFGPNGDPILQPVVPEPSTVVLVCAGVFSLLGYRFAASRTRRGK